MRREKPLGSVRIAPLAPPLFLLALLGGCAGGAGPSSELPESEALQVPGTELKIDLVRIPGTAAVRPFWISRREVSWEEFDRFYEHPEEERLDGITRPSSGKNYLGLSGLPSDRMDPHRPVTGLRIHSAIAYCEWLSKRTGCTFRLPTESEWCLACETPAAGARASGLLDLSGEVEEYCLEPDHPPDFGPVLRGARRPDQAASTRRVIPADWEEADPNRPFSTWWFRAGFCQGLRVVRVSTARSLGERAAYARRIAISGLQGEERAVKVGRSVSIFSRVTGTVENSGDRALSELILKVYCLNPAGKPHFEDVTSTLTRRATFNICAPVLANSAHPGNPARPLGPGERRRFALDLPVSLDADQDVQANQFGAEVLSLRFDPEDR